MQPSARPAGAYVFVLLCVCLSAVITCAKLHHPLLCHYSHERSGNYRKFTGSIGQGTSSYGERVVGIDNYSIFASYDR